MGHTVTSQRRMIDIVLNELNSYGKALRKEDRLIYEDMLKETMEHVGAISYTSSIDIWAMILLSIILQQQKQLNELSKHEHNERVVN